MKLHTAHSIRPRPLANKPPPYLRPCRNINIVLFHFAPKELETLVQYGLDVNQTTNDPHVKCEWARRVAAVGTPLTGISVCLSICVLCFTLFCLYLKPVFH